MKTLRVLKFIPFLLALALPIGCKSGITVSVSCGGAKPCTYGGSVTLQSGGGTNATPADLTAALNTGYEIIVTVPSNELKPDTNSVAQSTLTATTDTGYSSSILVNMTLVGTAPSSLVSGDTDYTYSIPSSAALTNWVDSVNLNTNETSTIVTATSTTFEPAGVAGDYTVYVQITSEQTGVVAQGNATFSDPGSGAGCSSGTSKAGSGNPSCPGGGTA